MANNKKKNGRKEVKQESGGRFSPCCCLVTVITIAIQTIVAVVIVYPSPIEPLIYTMSTPPRFYDVLTPNTKLATHSKRLLDNKIVGPESLVSYGHFLFASTYDKGVLKIDKKTNSVSQLPQFGKAPCGQRDWEDTCGRPLGMRIYQDFLYVVDAYLGLFKYDLRAPLKPAVNLLRDVVFGNDLVVSSNGLIYYTDSSRRWQRKDFMLLLLESTADGRLIQYNETSGVSLILSDELSFANGVEMSQSEDFILVAETNRARIARYWLKGPKAGLWDYFATNLPGLPDNIRRTPRNTYWVGIAAARLGHPLSVFEYSDNLFLRNLAAKLYSFAPNFVLSLVPKYGLLIELDEHGHIISSLHDPSGKIVPSISEVEEVDSELYLGSYSLPFLTRISLSKPTV